VTSPEDPTGKTPANNDKLGELAELLEQALTERPPAFGLVGVSGVGKSSTVNAPFRTQLPTSDTVSCTKVFRDVPLDVEFPPGPAPGGRWRSP
jgi:predicted GTPase